MLNWTVGELYTLDSGHVSLDSGHVAMDSGHVSHDGGHASVADFFRVLTIASGIRYCTNVFLIFLILCR